MENNMEQEVQEQGVYERVQKRIYEEDIELNFDAFFSNGWRVFKKSTLYIAMAVLVVGGIAFILAIFTVPFLLDITSMDDVSRKLGNPRYIRYMQGNPWMVLKFSLVSMCITFFIAPLQAGIIKMCREADQGEVNFGSLFSFFRGPYFLRLSLAAILIAGSTSLLGFFWHYLGILGTLLNYATILMIGVFSIYVQPLIIFGKATISEAINLSVTLVYRNFFPTLGIYILFSLLSFSGIIGCGIGVLFTIAFSFVCSYMLYKHTVGFPEDEIQPGEQPHWLETAPPTE